MKTADTMRQFMRHLLAMNKAAGTREWYAFLLRRFFTFVRQQGIETLSDIDGRLMLRYQHHVSELKNSRGHNYSVPTQNQHLIVVGLLFRYLRRVGDVQHDPTAETELARSPVRLPSSIPSVEEITKVIEQPDTSSLRGLRERSILELFYSTGMRRKELLNLDTTDVNFESGTILIRHGKGGKDRVVPLGKVAGRWLGSWLAVRNSFVNGHETDALFLSQWGRRFNKTTLRKRLAGYVQQAGVTRRITPHVFRHACATHMLDNGAGVAHLQRLLGHSRLDTTTTYLRVSIGSLKAVHSRCHPREKAA